MNNKYTVAFVVFLAVCAAGLTLWWMSSTDIALLHPKGLIALKERDLMLLAAVLMLFAVVPVYVLAFLMAWKYRASNTHAAYTPEHDHDLRIEVVWWGIPVAIILALGVITWNTTHALDPFKPIDSSAKPLTIQVVALDWKWLFIYPEQDIATVNFVQFPAGTPIDFEITADAPMNSFWIPRLGGQIYAMPGMSSQLHLIADSVDAYDGLSANFSGRGFAGMKFIAQSVSQEDFDEWVRLVKQQPDVLTFDSYDALARPSEDHPVAFYSAVEKGLYTGIVGTFLGPSSGAHDTH